MGRGKTVPERVWSLGVDNATSLSTGVLPSREKKEINPLTSRRTDGGKKKREGKHYMPYFDCHVYLDEEYI